MPARAMYRAVLRLEAIEVPVRFYAAVRDHGVHFRLLHAKDRTPVEQRMVHPATGAKVPQSDIVRGYPLERGSFVMLTDEELAKIEPESSRIVEVTRVVAAEAISHQFYDRPYFLGPDGRNEQYFGLVQALADLGKDAIARWTMRKHHYVGALQAHDGFLVLIALRSADEVVLSSELPAPTGRVIRADERRMAEQLVAMYAGDFDPKQYQDEYRERVLSLVETKAKGGKVHLRRAEPLQRQASLASALKASLHAAQKRKKVA